jgi:hypothetical protein
MLIGEGTPGAKNKDRHNAIAGVLYVTWKANVNVSAWKLCGFALKEQVFENEMLRKEFRYKQPAVSVYCSNFTVCSCHLML